MLMRMLKFICLTFVMAFSLPATAQERATADEAYALVTKAVELYTSAGQEKALAAFADPNSGFMPKDLFIFVHDIKGPMIMHPKNPALVGRDLSRFLDVDGKQIAAEMVKVANEKGAGWVDYKYVNPANKKIEQKSTYVQRVGDVFIACGIYKLAQ